MSIYRYTLCIRQIHVRTARSLHAGDVVLLLIESMIARLRQLIIQSIYHSTIHNVHTFWSECIEPICTSTNKFVLKFFCCICTFMLMPCEKCRVFSRLVCHPQLIMPIHIPFLIHIYLYLYSLCNSIRPSSALLCLSVCFIATHLKFP